MASAAALAILVNKSEFWHTKMDFLPKFSVETTQWPHYDDEVYESIVWDREYFV